MRLRLHTDADDNTPTVWLQTGERRACHVRHRDGRAAWYTSARSTHTQMSVIGRAIELLTDEREPERRYRS